MGEKSLAPISPTLCAVFWGLKLQNFSAFFSTYGKPKRLTVTLTITTWRMFEKASFHAQIFKVGISISKTHRVLFFFSRDFPPSCDLLYNIKLCVMECFCFCLFFSFSQLECLRRPVTFGRFDGPSCGLWVCFDRTEAERFTLAGLFLVYLTFLLTYVWPPCCPLDCTHICPHLNFKHLPDPSGIPRFMFKAIFYTHNLKVLVIPQAR